MPDEYELADLTREEAADVLYRLADGVAVGAVAFGEETIAVPERFTVELHDETEGEDRELEVDLEWPLSAEDDVDVAGQGGDAEPADASEGVQETDSPVSPVEVVEPGDAVATGSAAQFELYEDNAGEWRWRLVHANGNIIADSGEGYSRKANAKKGLRSVKRNAIGASVDEE